MTLGYAIPIKDSKYIKRVRVYGSIQQAFVFTHYNGGNPEVSNNGANALSQGIDFTAYPVPRTFSIGVNATF